MNFTGNQVVCKTLAEAFPSIKLWTLDLSDSLESMIFEKMEDLLSPDKETMIAALDRIHAQMTFSMHPLGHYFTVGDLMLWGAIRGSPALTAAIHKDPKKLEYPEIHTWYEEYMEKQPFIPEVFNTLNALNKQPAAVFPLLTQI